VSATRLPVAVMLAWCMALMACGGPDTPSTVAAKAHLAPPSPGREAPIETLLVTARPAPTSLTLSARIAYAEDRFSTISSPLQGRVLEVRAKLGQPVTAGEELLVIDSPDIATAYSDYVKEISELALATRNYELARDLYQAKALPLKDLTQAENDLNREKAEFRQAKEKLLTLRVPEAQLDQPLEQQTIGSRFALKSPLTGTVVARNVTPGQRVGGEAAQVLFTVVDLDTLQVIADVYERDLDLITVGERVTVTVESWPGESFPAVIASIGDIVDSNTRTVKIRATVTNDARKLKPEMFARLRIPMGENTSVLVIPHQAVVEVGGQQLVYVETNPGQYELRAIKGEKVNLDEVRVLEGLTAGEHIVARAALLRQTGGHES